MAVTPCLVSQRLPAERQARRDGPRQAGEAGVAERNQGDRGGDGRPQSHGRPRGGQDPPAGASERTGHAEEH